MQQGATFRVAIVNALVAHILHAYPGALMKHAIIDQAIERMQKQRFGEALPLLRRALAEDPTQWNVWYMAGQCYRFTNNIDVAVEHLKRAAQLNKESAPLYHALGIAHQLRSDWAESIEALRRAITLDPDCIPAYNSLALSQRKAGELEKAVHNYEAGVKALARLLATGMHNSRSSRILKHRDTEGTMWVGHAMSGALYLASNAEGIGRVAWPTDEQAIEEERTGRHGGLYWTDLPGDSGQIVRVYLPNYFNTFRELLRRDALYSNLIGNRGTTLELIGQHEDAQRHVQEASEFSV
jgi:tetratricopeptide (TPR) repeat protein